MDQVTKKSKQEMDELHILNHQSSPRTKKPKKTKRKSPDLPKKTNLIKSSRLPKKTTNLTKSNLMKPSRS